MDLQIKGKTAVITGGTKGIGAGIAKILAGEGVNLALVYRSDTSHAEAFAASLKSEYGVEAAAFKADITDTAAASSFFEKAVERLKTVDILINNAAGQTPEGIPFEELSYAQWQSCMDGCLGIVFTMSQLFLKECRRAGHGGHIVNVSAKAAFHSTSHDKIPYATAKGAIAVMTGRMANDFIRDGIFVNAIVPGYVLSNYYSDPDSPQCKAKEKDLKIGWAVPEDMGRITAFLCSPCSKQIIGAVIDASGGTML